MYIYVYNICMYVYIYIYIYSYNRLVVNLYQAQILLSFFWHEPLLTLFKKAIPFNFFLLPVFSENSLLFFPTIFYALSTKLSNNSLKINIS